MSYIRLALAGEEEKVFKNYCQKSFKEMLGLLKGEIF